MIRPLRPIALAIAVGATALALPSAAGAAEFLYGVTDANQLVTFHSDSPGDIKSSKRITGLQANETILGIDIRPETGQLFGVGSSSRLYVINPANGSALAVDGPFSPVISGTTVGWDFNPTSDRIRLVTDAEQNLRLDPDTGAVLGNGDGNLAYAPGDPGAGSNPAVGSAAYTNSVANANSTTLYGIDSARNALVTISPPNDGVLNTVGALGIDPGEPIGFDIAPSDGSAYAAFKVAGAPGPTLHRINLAGGVATNAATSNGIGANVIGIAVAGAVGDDRSAPNVSVSLSSTQLESRLLSQNFSFGVACDETCSVTGRLRRGGRTLNQGGTLIEGADKALVRITLGSTARSVIRRPGLERFDVQVTVTDAAGNTIRINRAFRTRRI